MNWTNYNPTSTSDSLSHLRDAVASVPGVEGDLALLYSAIHVQAQANAQAIEATKAKIEASSDLKASTTFNWGALISAVLAVVTPALSSVSPIFAALLPALGVLLNTLFPAPTT
jgi:hypothetical protein